MIEPVRLFVIEHAARARQQPTEPPQAGMKEARRRGVKFGRKKKLTPAQITKASKLTEHGERVGHGRALERGPTTLYRALTG